MSAPLVSISCLTFNHAPFLKECLDGFMMQQCNFDFEVLIHDDASTDGTQEIIKEYQAKYPEIIKPIFQTENQWSQGVRGMMARFNFPRAQGKYIALCEGDDYWTDPLKLQKQVDFLEEHEEYMGCGCYAHTLRFGKLELHNESIKKGKQITTPEKVLFQVPFATLTAVFRKVDFEPLVNSHFIVGDVELYMYLTRFGSLIKLDFIGGVYRYNGKGVSSGADYYTNARKVINARLNFLNYFKDDRKRLMRKVILGYIQVESKNAQRIVLCKKYNFLKGIPFLKFCISKYVNI